MIKKIEDMNYYELLEVSPRASTQEIHRAYERVRKIYDPNSIALYSLFSSDETEKIRQRVEEAYRTLLNDENRRAYDRTLRQSLGEPEQAALPFPSRPSMPPPGLPPLRVSEPAAASVPPAPAPKPAPAPAPPLEPLPAPEFVAEFTGPVIKALREQRKLSVQNVSDATKVSARHIEHIEEEAFTKLPPRPYLRGFLVLYARALGYDPDRIIRDYMKRYDAVMIKPK
jgi:curved DNA-binding protein CbpA